MGINFDRGERTDDILERNFIGKGTFELVNTSLLPKGILERWVEVRGQRAGTLIYHAVQGIQGTCPVAGR